MGAALTTQLTTDAAAFATDAASVGGAVSLFIITAFVIHQLLKLIPKR